jgi:nucleotide-binding universal stress UspA family protein
VHDHLQSVGARKLEGARELLRKTGVPHEARVLLGDPAPTIAAAAKELGCDEIVMGTRGLNPVVGVVLGSVATRVVHLTDLPVTLVK